MRSVRPAPAAPPAPWPITSAELQRRLGITRRQVEWWQERGYINPPIIGHQRLFDERETFLAALIAHLAIRGVNLSAAAKIGRRASANIHRFMLLLDSGREKYFNGPDSIVAEGVWCQGPVRIIDLDEIRRRAAGRF